MSRRTPWPLTLIVSAFFLATTPIEAKEKVVAYVPNWVNLDSFTPTIDFAKITHINIAFENPINDLGDLSFHKKNVVLISKAHEQNVKILVSTCGRAARRPARRNSSRGISSCCQNPNVATSRSGSHHTSAITVSTASTSISKGRRSTRTMERSFTTCLSNSSTRVTPLTSALSQGYGGKNVPDSVFEQFDFVNVMAYDGAGSWNPNAPGQHSSMEFAKRNVEYWLKRGLPASKTVLGVPFYGYGFGKAFRRDTYSYKEIVAAYPDAAKSDQVGETIWYNGVPTIEAKTRYAIDRKLAGIMIWSLDNDVKGKNSRFQMPFRGLTSLVPPEIRPAPEVDRVGFPKDYSKTF